jgi:hypothetical protein
VSPSSLAALLLLSPSLIVAQRLPTAPLDSGTLVRMHLSPTEAVRGRLVKDFTPSSSAFTFCPYPASPCASATDTRISTIPASQVTSIDKAVGTHVGRGLAIGGFIGAALGGLFLEAYSQLCDTSSCRAQAWRGFAVPFALGLGFGAAFGSASIRWGAVQ